MYLQCPLVECKCLFVSYGIVACSIFMDMSLFILFIKPKSSFLGLLGAPGFCYIANLITVSSKFWM